MVATMDTDKLQGLGSGMEMISGLRFLYENYEKRAWYWELVETSRKVTLTSGLILVGEESRSYIGLAWVIAVRNTILMDETHTRCEREQINGDLPCCYCFQPWCWSCE